ncbi:DUF542 domain-containing protein, partial [Arachidicoccus sp.]|uniref:DUF542 domain-containing protein n=1 Tax=Arachidicoccus sp. TaxID=1872624 RepID=UPI003D1985F2
MSTVNTTIDDSKVLDVTLIEPRLKHPTIFEYFDALKPGESFIIHNDHDPKPVYYQLMGERGNIFTFEYLEKGPEHWYIEIKKNPVNIQTGEPTVGDIAAKDYRKAEVFKKMGIDFCCGGEKSLKEASSEAGVTVEEVEKALAAADAAPVTDNYDYDKWPLDFLADFIINTHHQYAKDNAEVIDNMAHKVSEHHKTNHPELPELATKVHYFLQDILHHLQKEEEILFPNIKNLVTAAKNKTQAPKGMVSGPIQMMKMEHEHSGDDLKLFRKLTNNYTLPADACNSYKYLF